MFLDEAKITVKGGQGGRGCISWRREKYAPRGGPDGGDGGQGGGIFFIADENTDTLSNFASKKNFAAPKGNYGMGKNRRGKGGEDLYLRVPPGTLIFEDEEKKSLLADLALHDDQVLIAHGGRGGFGNAHFKSAVRQRPDFAELGEPGEDKNLKLELKLVADVGIIGYPSVGKSTLISTISAAKPKIAEYPFTTLVPNLGVVSVDDRRYVVCDVPGIIEGASEGKGLGHQFLRHIERCGILLHILDSSRENIAEDYHRLRQELQNYSPALAQKKELIVLNKIDLLSPEELTSLKDKCSDEHIEFFEEISAATMQGVNILTKHLLPIVLKQREVRVQQEREEEKDIPILRPHIESNEMGAYRIKNEEAKTIVRGKRLEQFTQMTDFMSEGALRRFRDVVERIGLKKALKSAEGEIYIGEIRVDEYI